MGFDPFRFQKKAVYIWANQTNWKTRPNQHLKYPYFDVSPYFYSTGPGATDSVNMSEVDSVVENFVRDALSQCDQSTVGETFKRVH